MRIATNAKKPGLLPYLLDRFKRIPADIKYVFFLFVTTRILLTILGTLAFIILDYSEPLFPRLEFSKHVWLNIWGVWDTGFFVDIAKNGYSTNYAVFPLYPLLMRIVGRVTGDVYIAGLIISNISLIIATVYLYKLVKIENNRKTAIRSVKYLFLFPTAFILSGVFSESLLLTLSIMCFYYAKKQKWFLSSVFGFLSGLTKPVGVFIFLPLLYEYWRTVFRSKGLKLNSVFLLLVPLSFPLFFLFVYRETGSVWAMNTLSTFLHQGFEYFKDNLFLGMQWSVFKLFESLFTLLLLALIYIFRSKLSVSHLIFAIGSILIPVFTVRTGLSSMPRYALIAFPLFILFAKLSRNNYVDQILTILLALFQGFLMVFWVTGFKLVV